MTQPARWNALDRLRGAALIAMALYHTTWDLHEQGLLSVNPVSHPAFMWSARIIAATFLLLSGVSLTLAHPERINWKQFWRREAQLLAVTCYCPNHGSLSVFCTISRWRQCWPQRFSIAPQECWAWSL